MSNADELLRLFLTDSLSQTKDKKMQSTVQRQKRGREEWAKLIDEIAKTPDGPIDENIATEAVKSPPPLGIDVKAYIEAAERTRNSYANSCVAPQLSHDEATLAKPPKAHETDIFAPVVEEPTTSGGVNLRSASASALAAIYAKKSHEEGPSQDFLDRLKKEKKKYSDLVIPSSMRNGGLRRQVDFVPIILVPSALRSPIQLVNVKAFLERGELQDTRVCYSRLTQDKAFYETVADVSVMSKPTEVEISALHAFPSACQQQCQFRRFRVLDDPSKIRPGEWAQVVACFVSDNTWQFRTWYQGEDDAEKKRAPANLFTTVRGYFPYFEEDRLPTKTKEWQVFPVVLTRKETKQYAHLRTAAGIWEDLYNFLNAHPLFRLYCIPAKN